MNSKKTQIEKPDRIEGDKIILDGRGRFPKRVIILESSKKREYRLTRTKRGGYLLN
jgi:hypothetical protein